MGDMNMRADIISHFPWEESNSESSDFEGQQSVLEQATSITSRDGLQTIAQSRLAVLQ